MVWVFAHRRPRFNPMANVVSETANCNSGHPGHCGVTSSKCAIIEKTSPDTALRDISDLVERGILAKEAGGGRSTSYSLT
jgi:predicted HTH transcriptional regulator